MRVSAAFKISSFTDYHFKDDHKLLLNVVHTSILGKIPCKSVELEAYVTEIL
jgi:hypothetical protein